MIPTKVMEHLKKGGKATHKDANVLQFIKFDINGKLVWNDGMEVITSSIVDNDWYIINVNNFTTYNSD